MKTKKSCSPPPILTPRGHASTAARSLIDSLDQPADTFLHKKDLARRLNVSMRTLDRWLQCGYIPSYKVGNLVRFDWTDVCGHLRSHFRLTPGGRHE